MRLLIYFNTHDQSCSWDLLLMVSILFWTQGMCTRPSLTLSTWDFISRQQLWKYHSISRILSHLFVNIFTFIGCKTYRIKSNHDSSVLILYFLLLLSPTSPPFFHSHMSPQETWAVVVWKWDKNFSNMVWLLK